jgi:SAM-dependent methyltransferase
MGQAGSVGHWDTVYGARDESALTWFEAVPKKSLDLIAAFAPDGAEVIDIGAGASRLVDGLLADPRIGRVVVLDLSEAALEVSRRRLGPEAAAKFAWVTGDVTEQADLPPVDIWHDRAAFHFLTDPDRQAAYLQALVKALRPGGHAILATFADDGPETCSGLPVQRYAPETLADRLKALAPDALRPVQAERHVHVTPKGNRQAFQTSVFRRLR